MPKFALPGRETGIQFGVALLGLIFSNTNKVTFTASAAVLTIMQQVLEWQWSFETA